MTETGWPDNMVKRAGAHSGEWQYAASNRVPRAASASRFGVFTTGCP